MHFLVGFGLVWFAKYHQIPKSRARGGSEQRSVRLTSSIIRIQDEAMASSGSGSRSRECLEGLHEEQESRRLGRLLEPEPALERDQPCSQSTDSSIPVSDDKELGPRQNHVETGPTLTKRTQTNK